MAGRQIDPLPETWLSISAIETLKYCDLRLALAEDSLFFTIPNGNKQMTRKRPIIIFPEAHRTASHFSCLRLLDLFQIVTLDDVTGLDGRRAGHADAHS